MNKKHLTDHQRINKIEDELKLINLKLNFLRDWLTSFLENELEAEEKILDWAKKKRGE